MAYLELKTGKKRAISADQGLRLWKALNDPAGLDEKQLTYLQGIKAIYLNWRTAPDEYVKENLALIIPIALHEWIYSRQGRPVKPGTDFAWRFARRWGLWDMGQPSALVKHPAFAAQPAVAYAPHVND